MLRRLKLAGYVALGVIGVLLIAIPIAFAMDMRAHRGEVARNVELGGVPIGGLTPQQLTPLVDAASGHFVDAPIRIDAPKGGFDTTTTALGVDVDKRATLQAALKVGRTGPAHARIWSWLRGYAADRSAPVEVTVDRGLVYSVVADEDPGPRQDPVEPSITRDGDRFVAVDGKHGNGIDAAEVIDALPDAARHGLPLQVRVGRGRIEPRFDRSHAEGLAVQANQAADRTVRVIAGETEAKVGRDMLRSWVTARAGLEQLELAIDFDEAGPDLAALLPDAGKPAVETAFTVEGGQVRVTAGKPGTRCCAPEAADAIAAELREPSVSSGPLRLPLAPVLPKISATEAGQLGVVEVVGTFETRHKAGEPRVKNIHRIADLVRGQVILPGKTFSVNDFVGRRTVQKGFVVDNVIEDGVFAEAVGGGISQFATTFFNASFFAGLGFGEYQSHSIYISRYPYGREATLSYPHPDLEIKNNTPYGVLIWPTYTSSSITVTLYSTKHLEVSQTGQTSAPKGNCTRVRTGRSIKNTVTGKVTEDAVFATYRPAEGVNC